MYFFLAESYFTFFVRFIFLWLKIIYFIFCQVYIFLAENYVFHFFSGVFASSESDEEDDRPKFSGRKRQKDYFAPVNFVSGGIKIGDKVTKEEADDAITVSNANRLLSFWSFIRFVVVCCCWLL